MPPSKSSARVKKAKPLQFKAIKAALTPVQKKFVEEYVKDSDPYRAALRAGVPEDSASVMGCEWSNETLYPRVAVAIQNKRDEIVLKTLKSPEDILNYLQTVCFFNPLRYFSPSEGGGWVMDEEQLRDLPDYIAMLIEDVSIRVKEWTDKEGNEVSQRSVWIRFVSKEVAMTLLAKFMLGEKMDVRHLHVNWDDLVKGGQVVSKADKLQELIRAVQPPPLVSAIAEAAHIPGLNGKQEQSNG